MTKRALKRFVREGAFDDREFGDDAKIRRLQAMREALRKLTATCSGKGPVTNCSILDALNGSAEF